MKDLILKEQLDAKELLDLIQLSSHKVIVLDVRSSMEYKRYHIKDALHIPIEELSINTLIQHLSIKKDDKYIIVTYCNAGGRGGRSFTLLKNQNTYENILIKNLTHGINQWIDYGFEIIENI